MDPLNLGSSSSFLGVDLLAELASVADGHRLHDEFHSASFACAVLAVTVLPEVAPFPVATCESVLIEEAHISILHERRQFNWLAFTFAGAYLVSWMSNTTKFLAI